MSNRTNRLRLTMQPPQPVHLAFDDMTTWLDTPDSAPSAGAERQPAKRADAFRRIPSDQFNLADLSNVVLADPLMAFQVLRSTARIERTRTFSESLNIEHALMILAPMRFEEFNKFDALESMFSLSQTGVDQIISLMSRSRGGAADQGLAVADGRTPRGRLLCGRTDAQCAGMPFRAETGVDKSFADLDVLARQAGFLDYKQMIERFYRKPASV